MRAANYVAGDEVVRTSRRERSIQREREEERENERKGERESVYVCAYAPVFECVAALSVHAQPALCNSGNTKLHYRVYYMILVSNRKSKVLFLKTFLIKVPCHLYFLTKSYKTYKICDL